MPTIYALSSGVLPSAVAVIRISGEGVKTIIAKMVKKNLKPRQACYCKITHPQTGELLDKVLAIFFPAPNSFSGEDMLELHCHGGRAGIDSIFAALQVIPNMKMAEAGEFSRRAFENGKLDLTQLEALGDILAAQTRHQQRQAMVQLEGSLRDIYEKWRKVLIRQRALLEANLDFSEEEDVKEVFNKKEIENLKNEITAHLGESKTAEITRQGFRIVLSGKPNAGKSSLLNGLARRDVAIVTSQAGTTRDIVEISLDIDGHLVIICDSAGIRESQDTIEKEGIRRAHMAMQQADMVLWLHAMDDKEKPNPPENAVLVFSKADLVKAKKEYGLAKQKYKKNLSISVKEENGLVALTEFLQNYLRQNIHLSASPTFTRQRHGQLLLEMKNHLQEFLKSQTSEIEAEYLRLASDCLGKLTGRIDAETLLDIIFKEFCIGK